VVSALGCGFICPMKHKQLPRQQGFCERDEYLSRIPVLEDERVVFVDVEDIIWIRSNRNSVQIHVPGRIHELRETMSALQARLDPRRFARVHRSAIVNIQRIKTIDPWFNGHHVITLDNGQQLRMSRYQHETFLRLVSTRHPGIKGADAST